MSTVAGGIRFPPVLTIAVVVLLAGPSGSGKSHLARQCGAPLLRLDDFYFDHHHPRLPRVRGGVDWDHPDSWDRDGAMRALVDLCTTRRATVPVYDIATSLRVGLHTIDLQGAGAFVAEGIFAPTLLAPVRAAGLPVEPIYLDRPRTLVAAMRLDRDLRTHRKPPSVLVHRGLALWRQQPSLRRQAVSVGFTPLSMRTSRARIAAMQTAR